MTVATHWHLHRPAEVDELGHLHLDGEVHLATSPELRAALVSAGLARRFAYRGHPYDGWVEASVRTPADAVHATWLFQLNYDRLCNVTLETLLSRITARTTRA